MSTLTVEVTTIDKVDIHPNADKLEMAVVKGWMCVVGKGQFKTGDKCIYIPIDSVLPDELVQKLFVNSKIMPKNGRIRTIKIRGSISQGLVVQPETVGLEKMSVGKDVTSLLGITKYEPPPVNTFSSAYGKCRPKPLVNSNFKKYTDIENFKNYPRVFVDGEEVLVTEKIHGTNFRAGYVKTQANTWWKKIKKFFGQLPEYEFVFGSHNVQLQDRSRNHKGWYDKNVYNEAVEKYELRKKLKEDEVIYAEIYGDGIQKGYTYGCAPEERKMVVFDIMKDGQYIDAEKVFWMCGSDYLDLPTVPLLYKGPFDLEKIVQFTKGESVLVPEQKIREGVVIKPVKEELIHMGRKILKYVSDEYLLREENTDFH